MKFQALVEKMADYLRELNACDLIPMERELYTILAKEHDWFRFLVVASIRPSWDRRIFVQT